MNEHLNIKKKTLTNPKYFHYSPDDSQPKNLGSIEQQNLNQQEISKDNLFKKNITPINTETIEIKRNIDDIQSGLNPHIQPQSKIKIYPRINSNTTIPKKNSNQPFVEANVNSLHDPKPNVEQLYDEDWSNKNNQDYLAYLELLKNKKIISDQDFENCISEQSDEPDTYISEQSNKNQESNLLSEESFESRKTSIQTYPNDSSKQQPKLYNERKHDHEAKNKIKNPHNKIFSQKYKSSLNTFKNIKIAQSIFESKVIDHHQDHNQTTTINDSLKPFNPEQCYNFCSISNQQPSLNFMIPNNIISFKNFNPELEYNSQSSFININININEKSPNITPNINPLDFSSHHNEPTSKKELKSNEIRKNFNIFSDKIPNEENADFEKIVDYPKKNNHFTLNNRPVSANINTKQNDLFKTLEQVIENNEISNNSRKKIKEDQKNIALDPNNQEISYLYRNSNPELMSVNLMIALQSFNNFQSKFDPIIDRVILGERNDWDQLASQINSIGNEINIIAYLCQTYTFSTTQESKPFDLLKSFDIYISSLSKQRIMQYKDIYRIFEIKVSMSQIYAKLINDASNWTEEMIKHLVEIVYIWDQVVQNNCEAYILKKDKICIDLLKLIPFHKTLSEMHDLPYANLVTIQKKSFNNQ